MRALFLCLGLSLTLLATNTSATSANITRVGDQTDANADGHHPTQPLTQIQAQPQTQPQTQTQTQTQTPPLSTQRQNQSQTQTQTQTPYSSLPPLFWVPNSSGLFSHLLQMKIMLFRARQLQRRLVVVPSKSPHYNGHNIDMCRIFRLPGDVTCGEVPRGVRCSGDEKLLQGVGIMGGIGGQGQGQGGGMGMGEREGMESGIERKQNNNTTSTSSGSIIPDCYYGGMQCDPSAPVRRCILRAVDLPLYPYQPRSYPPPPSYAPPYHSALQFDAREESIAQDFRRALGVKPNLEWEEPTSASAPAHDTQGGQEEGEGGQGEQGGRWEQVQGQGQGQQKEQTLADAYTVVHWRRGDQVTRCSKRLDTSVNCLPAPHLIAAVRRLSNDSIVYVATNEQESGQLQLLREAGFLTFEDVLAVEVSLMLAAPTFLAWGVSEIDDVVESERQRGGRTYCVGAREMAEQG
ncbi:hypothetical protein B484DRAFT_419051 [Ochromonadaceae sp. CCMP2298]|nr:hypothetical protein B484DRAFT_419051 [Ochromonadaceae sp. CCMP2298]